jgi:hypothetical protein
MNNKYDRIPSPTQIQNTFLECLGHEALLTGGRGSGKTTALLLAALQHIDVPGYSAILFRKTYDELRLPAGIVDTIQDWVFGRDGVEWNHLTNTVLFPSKATIQFGYLDHETDYRRYRSQEFQFIGIDQAEDIRETDYRYLLSRIRRHPHFDIPIRMRLTSSDEPSWVNELFDHSDSRALVRSTLRDNPHVHYETFRDQ